MRLGWVVLIGVVGCGRIHFVATTEAGATGDAIGDAIAVDPDAVIAPGVRLQARYWTAADGARVFASLYDPMIGSRCSFAPDQSGTLRCFPNEVLTTFAYADAGCVTPTLRVASGCASTPTLATLQAYDSASMQTRSHAVAFGASTPGFIGVISCSPAVDGAAYYLAGATVPDTMFVAGTQTTIDLGDGLQRLEVVADDGSQVSLGYAYQGTACQVRKLGATTAACIPSTPGAYTGPAMYSDASCSVEVAMVGGTPPPAYINTTNTETPCVGIRYASTGAQQTLSTLYVHDSAGACTTIAQTSATYTAISDATGTLPVLTRVVDTATTRLRTTAWVSPGGARLEAGLYDTTLAAPCIPTTDTTGVTTCAPLGYPWTVTHTTANCNGSPGNTPVFCDGADTVPGSTPIQQYATCDGLGVPLSTNPTKATQSLGYDKYAGVCVPMDLTDATMFTTATSAYQTSRVVALTLQ
jgi:hypothetical protein